MSDPIKPRPYGAGVEAECPTPTGRGKCGCEGVCVICGHKKHVGVHMHCLGEKPGDPPFGHEFKKQIRAYGRRRD